jgi:hypothetical protein
MATELRIQPLAASTAMLAAENTRLLARREALEIEIHELQEKLTMATTRAESRDIQSQIEAHNAALAELRAQQEAERQAEAQRAAEAAAKARRARMTGHGAALLDAHQSKLSALQDAEAHMVAAVAAINAALMHEAAERAAATALAAELGVKTDTLNLSAGNFLSRVVGALCHSLAKITACKFRRLGALNLLDDPHTRGSEPWAEREARYTSPSVELLLAHAETMRTN